MRSACAAVDRATPPPCTLWLRSGLLARYHCARRRMQCAMCQTSPRHVRSCVRRPEWRCLDTRVVSGLGARIVASLFFFRLHVRWRVFRYLCVSHVVAPWLWLDAAKEFWAIGGGAGARGGGRRAGGGEPARGSRTAALPRNRACAGNWCTECTRQLAQKPFDEAQSSAAAFGGTLGCVRHEVRYRCQAVTSPSIPLLLRCHGPTVQRQRP